jgi:hypothetical protein
MPCIHHPSCGASRPVPRVQRPPLVIALLLAATACSQPYRVPARPSQSADYSVAIPAGVDRLEIQFHDGLLTLEPGPRLECSVTVDVLADDPEALQTMAEKARPEFHKASDSRTASLQVALPSGSDLNDVRTTWRVRAPAGATVAVRTRNGGVVARGATSDLEVDGGSGFVDARMAGGAALLATTSGSLALRGDYLAAELRSSLGRIDVCAPKTNGARLDLRVNCDRGGVYLDLLPGQRFDFQFHGETRQVECDPEVRVQWQQIGEESGIEYTYGRLGNLVAASQGKMVVDANSAVRVRLQPGTESLAGMH